MFSVVVVVYARIPEIDLFDKDDGYSVTLIFRHVLMYVNKKKE